MVILPAGVDVGLTVGVGVGLTVGVDVGLAVTAGEIAGATATVPSTRAGIARDANTRIRGIRPMMITL